MATEEQTSITGYFSNVDYQNFWGQRLTITNRTVSKLSMPCADNGGDGNLILGIKRVSNDSTIMEKVWGAVSSLVDYPTYEWAEVTFDTPTFINEEVRIYARTSGSVTGCMIYYLNADTKPNELSTRYFSGAWTDYSSQEAPYIYTYDEEGSAAPVVTTQACTDTIARVSTGHGNLQSLGTSAVTQHGHCWDTSTDPTTALDTKTENGAAPNKGPFTSLMTGLAKGTTYYVRAYATNTTGTSYGTNVTIGTSSTIGKRYWWSEKDEFHWFDEWGNERFVKGTAVTGADASPWWLGGL